VAAADRRKKNKNYSGLTMGFLSFLGLGNGDIKTALKKGAVIIDVRTPNEYDEGRVRESINIPVDRVSANSERIKQFKKAIIFCCSSGSRSATATRIMKEKGLKEVYNGGSWEHVLKLQKSI
jgi:phage shock protein E